MKNILASLSLLFLVACGSADQPSIKSTDYDSLIFKTQGYYNAAVLLEIAYDKLPACGKPTSPPICSDLVIKKKIRKIDEAAWAAITEAKVAVDTPGFGENKLATIVASATALTRAFSDMTETLPKEQ